ncbi:MAG TPA: serine hydrolase domain-containing protein [Bryobacteraceae bacterium]|jgi:CubicO group peptidase (beta-lactamase class C family)|nr:serine hydrolase domain-containing protein [Bryobacteraceae bacterium]
MTKVKKFLPPALLIAISLQAAAPPLNQDVLKLVRGRMQEYIDRGEIAGIVTLVGRDGQIAELDGVGYADIENHKPMRSDTIVQIMSQTKTFTGVAAMILVDEGKLDVTRAVEDYLPEFKGIQVAEKKPDGMFSLHPPKHAPTVWELMCHTSGMKFLPATGEFAHINYTMDRTLAEAVRSYATEHLVAEPGSKFIYSNMGIATLGRIVEVLSGIDYAEFVKQRILVPLGMKDTFYYPPKDKEARIAMVYMTDADHRLVMAGEKAQGGDPAKFRKGAKYSGPELALFSTASDLFRFYEMLANHGTYGGERILSAQAVEAMTHDYTPNHSNYGFTLAVLEGTHSLFHLTNPGTFGHGGAFGSVALIDPKNGLVMIFLPQMLDGPTKQARYQFLQLAEAAVP